MRQAFRRQAEHSRLTVIVVRFNIGLSLLGLAALVTALIA
jgi:hypothetical protein